MRSSIDWLQVRAGSLRLWRLPGKTWQVDEAICHYQERCQDRCTFGDAHMISEVAFQQGQVAEAKDHFQKASNLNPNLAQPHNYLGKVFIAKETSTTLSYNSKRRCVFILTFQKPRKTCALLNRVKRQMDTMRREFFVLCCVHSFIVLDSWTTSLALGSSPGCTCFLPRRRVFHAGFIFWTMNRI